MKTLIALLVIVCGLASHAETQFLRVTNIGASTNYLTIPANTTAECIGWQGTMAGFQCDSGFGYQTWFAFYNVAPSGIILGPSTLKIYTQTNAIHVFKLETVNTAPVASLVAPAGNAAVLSVETSTNLTTWQTVTNAAFPKTDSHRFFRTRLMVQ